MPLILRRVLSRLNSRVAVVFDLPDIPSTLSYKLKDLRVYSNIELLYICQGYRRSLMTSEPAHGSDEIVLSRRAKVNSLIVSVDKLWHIVLFIDVSLIAYDLPTLFRSQRLCCGR